ncbi:MAG: hypothetical protein RL734_1261 [Bacteroidota bacterium]|jgi:hypothetical protein
MRIVLIFIIGIALYSCSDNIITSPDQIVFPQENVSYQQQVRPLLELTCAFSNCHDSETAAAGVDVTGYFQLTSRAGLIIPGRPDNSLLMQILEGKQGHLLTFQNRITDAQKKGVRQWVLEGALNN